jgi:hypothetical protein
MNGNQMKFLSAVLATAASCYLVTTHLEARADEAQKYFGDVNSYATCWGNLRNQVRLYKEATGDGSGLREEKLLKAVCNKAAELVVDGLNWPTAMVIATRQLAREGMSR